jgi:hypothetical protein
VGRFLAACTCCAGCKFNSPERNLPAAAQAKDADVGCLQRELQAAREEVAGWQRRSNQLQDGLDGRDLELARRDLRVKVRCCSQP